MPKPLFISAIFNENQINKLKSKYVMLYTENIGIVADDTHPKMLLRCALDPDFMSGKNDSVEKVSAFCFWGEQVANVVRNSYPPLKNKCYVVGHPRHDKRAIGKNSPNNKSYHKKSVGIITRFVAINDYYERNPIADLVNRFLNDDILYEYKNQANDDFLINEKRGSRPDHDLFLEIIDIKIIIKIIKRLKADGYNVSIKIHPRENPDTWRKIDSFLHLDIDIVDPQLPFSSWAVEQNCVIGPPSTSFYDCFMLGITPISIANIDPERQRFVSKYFEENNKLMEHVIAPYNIDDLLDNIRQIESNDFFMSADIENILYKEANFPLCSKSIEALGSVVKRILETEPDRTLSQFFGLYFYNFFRSAYTLLGVLRNFLLRRKITSSNFLLTPITARKIKIMGNF
ncbi:polysialyltransferase family glycosyltransferase [Candidatus Methylopumilus rimovensis]|uniref:polysialyltransferase family glycosyltransferase n=1 Tax=Candidatus Methylopumilus rimovensis TaxID=2588535 RepID=UPI002A4E24DB|nr:polysialyltransferase family glycosyltransferase [Candidatus Methylopumilus rimovensis]